MTSRPKLLFVAVEFPFPGRNGLSMKASNYIRRLADKFEITLIAYVDPDRPPSDEALREARKHCRKVITLERRDRNALRSLLRLDPPFLSRYRSRQAVACVRAETRAEHYSVAHFDGVGAVFLRDALATPETLTVASPNDVYALMLEGQGGGGILQRISGRVNVALVRAYERRCYSRFHQVHFVAEVDCEYASRMRLGVPVHRVPLGIDPGSHLPSGREEPDNLLFIANLALLHGSSIVEFIERHMPLVWQHHPAAKLTVVGVDPPARLLELAAGEGRLQVTGWVEDVGVAAARGSIALSLNPLVGGMQTKVLEAMAMGKAVVGLAHNFASIDGAVEGEHFLAGSSPEEVALRVVQLLEHPERTRAMGRAARALVVKNFSWDTAMRKYTGLVGAAAGLSPASAAGAERVPV